MVCPKCGNQYEGNPALCQSCGRSLARRAPSIVGGKRSAKAKKPSTAAFITVCLMVLVVAASTVGGFLTEDGYLLSVKTLVEGFVGILLASVVYAIAQITHRIIKHTWMDFQGWWRWWREFLPF